MFLRSPYLLTIFCRKIERVLVEEEVGQLVEVCLVNFCLYTIHMIISHLNDRKIIKDKTKINKAHLNL